MVLATLFVTLPFMIRELAPILEAFGVQQEQAAATLGASGWTTFRRITLPALRWGFIYGVTLTLARALGEFGAVLVIGGGIQGRTETATLYIYRALDERQYVGAYSAALVLGLFSLLLVLGTEFLRQPRSGGSEQLTGQSRVSSCSNCPLLTVYRPEVSSSGQPKSGNSLCSSGLSRHWASALRTATPAMARS